MMVWRRMRWKVVFLSILSISWLIYLTSGDDAQIDIISSPRKSNGLIRWKTHLPFWEAQVADKRNGIHDLYLPCSLETCKRHLSNMPEEFLKELIEIERLRLVYVMSGGIIAFRDLALAVEHKVYECCQENVKANRSSTFAVMLFDDVPENSPPVEKEFAMLRHFRDAFGDPRQLFVKLDTDALFVPERLVKILDMYEKKTNRPFYSGRPVTSCECEWSQHERAVFFAEHGRHISNHECLYDTSVHFCSGFFYITTRTSLNSIPDEHFVQADNGTRQQGCQSSDYSVGKMMNTKGLLCENLLSPDSAGRHGREALAPGISFPMNKATGRGIKTMSSICQQQGSPGGIHDRETVLFPWLAGPGPWGRKFYQQCSIFHPAKQKHDWTFLWLNYRNISGSRGGYGKRSTQSNLQLNSAQKVHLDSERPPRCTVRLIMYSDQDETEVRKRIRTHWALLAKSYEIEILFVVVCQSIRIQIEREQREFGDISLFRDFTHLARILTVENEGVEPGTEDCSFVLFASFTPHVVHPYQLLKALEHYRVAHGNVVLQSSDATILVAHRLAFEYVVPQIRAPLAVDETNSIEDPFVIIRNSFLREPLVQVIFAPELSLDVASACDPAQVFCDSH